MLVGITWTIIILLFIISFVGLIIPIIPSSIAIWLGFILYHFIINDEQLTLTFWIVMIVLTVIIFVADILTNSYFVNKFGGSKWGEWGAVIALIVGAFIMPPFGIIILPFVTVLLIELLQQKTVKEAFYSSIGSLAGFLSGLVAKSLLQLIMIIWFLFVVFI